MRTGIVITPTYPILHQRSAFSGFSSFQIRNMAIPRTTQAVHTQDQSIFVALFPPVSITRVITAPARKSEMPEKEKNVIPLAYHIFYFYTKMSHMGYVLSPPP